MKDKQIQTNDPLYCGVKGKHRTDTAVTKESIPLDVRRSLRIIRASSSFDWGHFCRGARQLAAALLFDATGNTDTATRYSETFALEVVSQWKQPKWKISRSEVLAWVDAKMGVALPEGIGQ